MSDTAKFSACKYCGQTAMVEAQTEAEALHLATMQCDCEEALNYRSVYMKAEEAVTEMKEMYSAEKVQDRLIDIAEECIGIMALGMLNKMTLELPNGKKLKVARKGHGFSVECSKADKKKVEV